MVAGKWFPQRRSWDSTLRCQLGHPQLIYSCHGTIPNRGISAGTKWKPDSSFCSASSITLEFPCCLATAAAETRALSLGTREGITLQMVRFKELEGERRNPHITLGGFLPSHPHSLSGRDVWFKKDTVDETCYERKLWSHFKSHLAITASGTWPIYKTVASSKVKSDPQQISVPSGVKHHNGPMTQKGTLPLAGIKWRENTSLLSIRREFQS